MIFGHLPKLSLLNCRLAHRSWLASATALAFHHVNLSAYGNPSSFRRIAQSPHLAAVVREVTCDSNSPPSSFLESGRPNDHYPFPTRFLEALPALGCLRGLCVLNVRLCKRPSFGRPDPQVMYLFRAFTLEAILQVLAGAWTDEWRTVIEDGLNVDEPLDWAEFPDEHRGQPASLRQLTIYDLYANFTGGHLAESAAFRQLASQSTLQALKLLIAPTPVPEMVPKHHVFAALPRLWLSPALTDSLRELSLYCRTNWRNNGQDSSLGSINGLCGSFPNLRVLALGHYVFTDLWQVDWISKLGGGQLEELYLDRCAVIHSEDDDVFVTTPSAAHHARHSLNGPPSDITWNQIFTQWQNSPLATSLRVFVFGYGAWSDKQGAYAHVRAHWVGSDAVGRGMDEPAWAPRPGSASDRIFLRYGCTQPSSTVDREPGRTIGEYYNHKAEDCPCRAVFGI